MSNGLLKENGRAWRRRQDPNTRAEGFQCHMLFFDPNLLKTCRWRHHMGEAGHCWLGGHFPLPELAHRSKCPPSAASCRSSRIFLLVSREVSSSFAEVQPRRQGEKKKRPLNVLRLRFLCAQRLQKYLSNITVCWRFSVTRKKKKRQILLRLSISGRVCSSSTCNRSMLLKSISIYSFI